MYLKWKSDYDIVLGGRENGENKKKTTQSHKAAVCTCNFIPVIKIGKFKVAWPGHNPNITNTCTDFEI